MFRLAELSGRLETTDPIAGPGRYSQLCTIQVLLPNSSSTCMRGSEAAYLALLTRLESYKQRPKTVQGILCVPGGTGRKGGLFFSSVCYSYGSPATRDLQMATKPRCCCGLFSSLTETESSLPLLRDDKSSTAISSTRKASRPATGYLDPAYMPGFSPQVLAGGKATAHGFSSWP